MSGPSDPLYKIKFPKFYPLKDHKERQKAFVVSRDILKLLDGIDWHIGIHGILGALEALTDYINSPEDKE